jgi:hypothetical protein
MVVYTANRSNTTHCHVIYLDMSFIFRTFRVVEGGSVYTKSPISCHIRISARWRCKNNVK